MKLCLYFLAFSPLPRLPVKRETRKTTYRKLKYYTDICMSIKEAGRKEAKRVVNKRIRECGVGGESRNRVRTAGVEIR